MSESLRDQLSEHFTELEQQAEAGLEAVDTASTTSEVAEAAETSAPAATDKPGRTAGRARDEQGRLLPGPAKKDAAPATPSATTEQAVAVEPLKPLQRPSTLKKELWPIWDKLARGEALTAQEARQKAEWILQRDSDYAKGVSTYKAEADNAKPIVEAIAPFLPALQANNVQPAQWISQLGNAHQTLVYGAPQQKAAMFAQMMTQYQIDPSWLFVQGQDGKVYLNPQLSQAAPQQQQRQQPDVRQTVQELLAEERARSEVERMKSDAERYPHFDAVRNKMAGLLQAGLATDYDDAYKQAVRLDPEIYEAQQQQQRQAEEDRKREEARRAAEAARRNAISPRTSTPTAAAAGTNGKKGLRDTLSENFDAVAVGRV